jgi:cell pole-organizing protein PopZ
MKNIPVADDIQEKLKLIATIEKKTIIEITDEILRPHLDKVDLNELLKKKTT